MAATMLACRGNFLTKLNFNYQVLYCYSSTGGKGKKLSEQISKIISNDRSKKLNRKEQVTSKNDPENEDQNLSPRVDIGQKIAESNAEFSTEKIMLKSEKKMSVKSEKSENLGKVLSKFKNQTPKSAKSDAEESSYEKMKVEILNRMIQSAPVPKPKPKSKPKPEPKEEAKPRKIEKQFKDELKLSIREIPDTTGKKSSDVPQPEPQKSFIYFVDKDAPVPEENVDVVQSKPGQETEESGLPVVDEDTESFSTLLRNSKLMQIGSYKSRVVSGTIINIVEDDMYIDFGGKFHCVCKKPAVEDTRKGNSYILGNKVKVRINDLEMTSKFLGADRHVTILEADATLIGIKHRYDTPSEFKSVFSNPDSTSSSQPESTLAEPESNINQSDSIVSEPESVISQSETLINEMETNTNNNVGDKM